MDDNRRLSLSIDSAISEGTVERDLIGLLDPSAGRKPLCDPGHMDTGGSQHLGQIVGGRLPLDIGSQGEDHFGGTLLSDALDQLRDAKFFGTDAVQRRELPSQGVIATPEDPSTLKRQDIGGGFHNAKFAPGACFVPAKGTLLGLGKESAESAGPEHLSRPADRPDKLLRLGIRRTEHPKGNPLSTARPDSRKPAKLPHQLAKRLGIVEGHGVGRLLAV